ncbi:XRE family transcriptional regulator [Leeia sp. TBRC 13508]|uniref:XRE family transcriptional regulator n=1 Tax=Leeia speluncae TaxID=2884804 RepID=A0ABS8DAC3_9NEIS|nr:XRE family transcriptional regulator [Leeia speluncae]MCB6185119.1 XRE family transcriptional regulator [Leeia speluncae]
MTEALAADLEHDVSLDRVSLGKEIRSLRKARGKKLSELASATGRSISFISQLERGNAESSISDLRRIAHALGVPLGWFLITENKPSLEIGRVVRSHARRRLGEGVGGLSEELLSPHIGGSFETFLTTIQPGTTIPESCRETEEECFVLQGQLEICIGGHTFTVTEGDTFRIAGEPYHWKNTGDIETKIIWIISPPIY